MDNKMKVIMSIFAIIALIYVIHFSISYVSRRKKESFSNDEEEHFSDDQKEGNINATYSLGMDVLKLVDAEDEKLSLGKKLKSEVVRDLFGRMDDLKALSKTELGKEVAKVAKTVKDKGITEKFEDTDKKESKDATESASTELNKDVDKTPTDVKPPVAEKEAVNPPMEEKITAIKGHLKSATDLLNTIVPEKRRILNIPEIPITPPKPATKPDIKENFEVFGFEHVAQYAGWGSP